MREEDDDSVPMRGMIIGAILGLAMWGLISLGLHYIGMHWH